MEGIGLSESCVVNAELDPVSESAVRLSELVSEEVVVVMAVSPSLLPNPVIADVNAEILSDVDTDDDEAEAISFKE